MNEFDSIRPYEDPEIPAAVERLANDPLLEPIAAALYPDQTLHQIKERLLSIKSADEFQTKIMSDLLVRLLDNTSDGIEFEGIEQLDKTQSYLFVSNHRDIMLDSALLQLGLWQRGYKTSQISFGSNLMKPEFVVDFGKINKMFRVERSTNTRQAFEHSQRLSAYIRHTICEQNESIWIAQRNGRTKDGNDTTEKGLLKMFAMSGDKARNTKQRLEELNIVPVVISYRWEPCDALKTQELYIARRQKYEKAPGEDLRSIVNGIEGQKGRISLKVLRPINQSRFMQNEPSERNDFFRDLAQQIDRAIRSSYRLFDTNYIAYDMLNRSIEHLGREYTNEELRAFRTHAERAIEQLQGAPEELRSIFLEIYANPVKNKLNTTV